MVIRNQNGDSTYIDFKKTAHRQQILICGILDSEGIVIDKANESEESLWQFLDKLLD